MKVNFYDIKDEYKKLKNGKPKMAAIKKAIQKAEEEKDYDWQLVFMEDYIREAVFYEDNFDAFIIFPEYLSIFDKNEQNLKFYRPYDMIWVYKWIVNNSERFYQISYNKIEQYFEDFKIRCLKYGYSLRVYEYEYSNFIESIDIDKFKEISLNYLNYKRDEICDCETCELNHEIRLELFYGSFEKAMEKAKPIIDGVKRCHSAKPSLYNSFISYYIDKKDVENCEKYEKILYKEIKNNINYLSYIGTILEFCALKNVNRGLQLFQKHLIWYLENKNPNDKFYFALGVYKLFKSIKENRIKKTVKLLLPKKFFIYQEDGVYNIDDIINYFESDLLNTADKFDKRNGNTYYFDEIYNDKKYINKI